MARIIPLTYVPRTECELRRALAALLFGFGLPVAVVALSTGVRNFVFWTLTGSSDYASADGAWLNMLERAVGNSAILASAAIQTKPSPGGSSILFSASSTGRGSVAAAGGR